MKLLLSSEFITAFCLWVIAAAPGEASLPLCTLPWEQIGSDITGDYDGSSFEMGRSIALSSNGRILAIGEHLWKKTDNKYVGRVHTYVLKEATEWFETTSWEAIGGTGSGSSTSGYIYVDDSTDQDYDKYIGFGFSIALSSDGRTLIVGAPHAGNNIYRSGAIRIYILNDDESEWIQLGSTIRPNHRYGTRLDNLGWVVESSSNGRTIVVGASPTNEEGCAIVYTYDNDENNWIQKGPILRTGDGRRGSSVSISGDGRIVAIGTGSLGNSRVRVYYYKSDKEEDNEENSNGASSCIPQDEYNCIEDSDCCGDLVCWTRGSVKYCDTALFHLPDEPKGTWKRIGDDLKGETVSLSHDGRTLAVGQPNVSGKYGFNRYRSNSGVVRIFYYHSEVDHEEDGTGTTTVGWNQIGNDILGEHENDNLGSTSDGAKPLAISGDGMTVVIGAGGNVANEDEGDGGQQKKVDVGHVRVFSYNDNQSIWNQIGLDMDGSKSKDRFGDAVAISYDERIIAVGAFQDKLSYGEEQIPNFVRGSGYGRVYALSKRCALSSSSSSPSSSSVISTPMTESSPASAPEVAVDDNDDNNNYYYSDDLVNEVIDSLSEEQKEVIDKLQEYALSQNNQETTKVTSNASCLTACHVLCFLPATGVILFLYYGR